MEEREMIADAMPGVVHEEAAAYAAEPVPETISVLMVEPGKYPREIEIGTELEDLQAAVGGNIEVFYPFEDQVGLVMNEEGKQCRGSLGPDRRADGTLPDPGGSERQPVRPQPARPGSPVISAMKTDP